MEGRHLAVLGAISIWCIACFVSYYIVNYRLSNGLIPNRLRKSTNRKIIVYTSISTLLSSFFMPGLFYRIGGAMERGNGIAWGCYIEDYFLGTALLWFVLFFALTLLLIIGLFKPTIIKFNNRKHLIIAYLIVNSLNLIWLILGDISINIFSGPLSGSESSCL